MRSPATNVCISYLITGQAAPVLQECKKSARSFPATPRVLTFLCFCTPKKPRAVFPETGDPDRQCAEEVEEPYSRMLFQYSNRMSRVGEYIPERSSVRFEA